MNITFPIFDNTPNGVLFILFLVSSALLLFHACIFLFRFTIHNTKKQVSNDLPPVSVIICARNEEDNLLQNLEPILNQDYPTFEVVLVNHQSVDGSKSVLYAMQKQYKHLKVIHIERNMHLKIGKKLPLSVGIKGASYGHLLLTDADCLPQSQQWIRQMCGKFNDSKELILGYGPYAKEKGFLNFLIRFDTVQIAINYFSLALNGMAYMGVGRNMAYTKSLYQKANGFKSHYGLASGDDDLFVKDAASRKNVAIQYSPETFCVSPGKKLWREWVEQKQRHFTTAPQYKVITKLLLGIFPFALLMQLFSLVFLSFDKYYSFWALVIFGSIFLLRWLLQIINFNKLKAIRLALFYPFVEWIHIAVTTIIFYARGNDSNEWK